MKHLFAQTFLLLALFGASAHDVSAMAGKYSVKGRVVDTDTKKPIEFASYVCMPKKERTNCTLRVVFSEDDWRRIESNCA